MHARVTVVVPCYNDGLLVRQLEASLDEPELVDLLVVDDGSTSEESTAALKELHTAGKAKVIWQRNGGTAAAIRAGVEAATTTYIFYIGADDLLAPGGISALANTLDSDRSVAFAYGDHGSFGATTYIARMLAWDPWVMLTGCYTGGLLLFRREVYLALSETLSTSPSEDWDLMLSAIDAGYSGRHVDKVVFYWRRHAISAGRRSTSQNNRAVVAGLKVSHPDLFAHKKELRRQSTLSVAAKLRYWLSLQCFCYLPEPLYRLLAARYCRTKDSEGDEMMDEMRLIVARVTSAESH